MADVVLDRDFGGCLGGVLRESACEVDRRSPALLVYSGSAMKRFSLTRGQVEVSKGWCLDEVAREDCERGAFPRVVKHLPLLQTNCLYDEHDMWHDDGYTLLLGWVLCVEHSAHAALRVISEEASSMLTHVQVSVAAAPAPPCLGAVCLCFTLLLLCYPAYLVVSFWFCKACTCVFVSFLTCVTLCLCVGVCLICFLNVCVGHLALVFLEAEKSPFGP